MDDRIKITDFNAELLIELVSCMDEEINEIGKFIKYFTEYLGINKEDPDWGITLWFNYAKKKGIELYCTSLWDTYTTEVNIDLWEAYIMDPYEPLNQKGKIKKEVKQKEKGKILIVKKELIELEAANEFIYEKFNGQLRVTRLDGNMISLKENTKKGFNCLICENIHLKGKPYCYIDKNKHIIFGYNEEHEDKLNLNTMEIIEKYPDAYINVKNRFEKNNFKCLSTSSFYEITNNDIIIRSKGQLITAYEHLIYVSGDKTKTFIKQWLIDPSIRNYMTVKLLPPPQKIPSDCFNLWDGFRITKIQIPGKSIITNGLQLFKDHVMLISGPENYDYVLKWIAKLIQLPGTKPKVCIVMKSLQGLGKEILFRILEAIIGKKYCLLTQNVDRDIFGNFNGLTEGKILFVFDEMNIKLSSKHSDAIKDFISNPDTYINDKNIKCKQCVNYNHTFVFSNKAFPWALEESDRRTLAIDRSSENIPDTIYFNPLYAIIEDDYVLNEIYNYLLTIDITKFNPKDDRPVTEFSKELKKLSQPRELHFLIDYIQKYNEIEVHIVILKELFSEFNVFLIENYKGDKSYNTNSKTFSVFINALNIPGITNKHTKSGSTFTFVIKDIINHFINKGFISN